MIQQYLGISPDKLIKAGWETLYMVGFSLIIGSIVGFFIAIVLWLTRKGGLKENPLLYTILNGFINIIRSTPVSDLHHIHRRICLWEQQLTQVRAPGNKSTAGFARPSA